MPNAAMALNWAPRASPTCTSRRTTCSARWPNCDGGGRCRGMHGKSASRRRCGCRATAMSSCCREVYVRGKARTKSVAANGIALFLEVSYEPNNAPPAWWRPRASEPSMSPFLDDRDDSDVILDDIRIIVEIESPSRNAAGVNRVLETIARSFEGAGAACEREPTTDSLGDILRVRCDPTRSEPGILVLSHMDTVHPIGTLAGKLAYRREGDRVYGPGISDMKGGLMLAVAPFRRIAQAERRAKMPMTFRLTPGGAIGKPALRNWVE